MKRCIIKIAGILLWLFTTNGILNAQSGGIFFYESFDNGIPSTWTNIDSDGDGYKWRSGMPLASMYTLPYAGADFATSESYSYTGGVLHPDNWLISPAFTLTNVADLQYYIGVEDANYYGEYYGVYISTSGTALSDFSLIFEERFPQTFQYQQLWYFRNLDLSAYNGKTIRIAFRHFNCTNWYRINLDEVFVMAKPTTADCDSFSVPFTEGFENNGLSLPQCWTQEYVNGTVNWETTFAKRCDGNPQTAHSGNFKMRMYTKPGSFTQGHITKLVSPSLNLACLVNNQAQLTFWHTQQSNIGSNDTLRVYYRNAPDNTWTLLEQYSGNITTWTQRTLNLPNLSGTYQIAFEGIMGYGSGVQLDDISITGTPQTPPPGASNVMATMPHTPSWYTVNLSWSPPSITNGLSGYNIYRDGIKLNGTAPVTGTSYMNETPSSGSFTYGIEAVWVDKCPSNRAFTTIIMPANPCSDTLIHIFPSYQGFENDGGNIPFCWSQEQVTGTTLWTVVAANSGSPSSAHSGSYKAIFYNQNDANQTTKLIPPAFDLSGGPGVLTFWYVQRKLGTGQDHLKVYYKNSPTGAWTLLTTFQNEVSAWTKATVNLPNPTTSYWIAFEGTSNKGHGIHLDDIQINGCAIVNQFPYNESFEIGGSISEFPGCWTQEQVTGSQNWAVAALGTGTPASVHSGTYKARYYAPVNSANTTKLIGPTFESNQNFSYIDFSFWQTQPIKGSAQDKLKVYYQSVSGGTWKLLKEYSSSIADWKQSKFLLEDASSYLRFAFEATGANGNGIQLDDIKITGCNAVNTFPYLSNFDNQTGIPGCWGSESSTATQWNYITNGTSPACVPHSGSGMLQFESKEYASGSKGKLISPPVNVTGNPYTEVSFWMYRDANVTDKADLVNVYMSNSRDISGLMPFMTIHRNITQEPIETSAGWHQYSTVLKTDGKTTVYFIFEGVSEKGNNIYIDDIQIGIYECTPVSLPLWENFEDYAFFPPLCWTSKTETNSPWRIWDVGVSPSCLPQDGIGMLQYKNMDFPNLPNSATMCSRPFYTEGKDQALSFWMYRDPGFPTRADRVNVYLSNSTHVIGLQPLLTVNRSTTLSPVVEKEGWYFYTVLLPCANMEIGYVIFEAVGATGNNMYIDNARIGECLPAQNINTELFGTSYPQNHIKITWNTPLTVIPSLLGYNIYRNGVKIVNTLNALEYIDNTNLTPGKYTYCIEAVYNNHCGISEQISSKELIVVGACPNVEPPTGLVADFDLTSWYWYDVDLSWNPQPTVPIASYCKEPNESVGTVDGVDFMAAVRWYPEDLTSYTGLKISHVSFVPYAKDVIYTIKIWSGGNGLNPGTIVHEQEVPSELLKIGLIWNTITLNAPVIVDPTKELWIGISYHYTTLTGHPAGCDLGPTAAAGKSDLLYDEGEWMTLSDAGLPYNWCIKANLIEQNKSVVIGYNVFRNSELLTKIPIPVTKLSNTTPGEGVYLYEVAAVYEDFCESTQRAQATATLIQSPCEGVQYLPFFEDFEDDHFPSSCWRNLSPTTTFWKPVHQGTHPLCFPHSGETMLCYHSWNYLQGSSALLVTPLFATEKDYTLTFWMHRDPGFPTPVYGDQVNVYLSASPSIEGLTPLLTINRCIQLSPVEPEKGWYQYSATLPTEGMNSAYVIFEAKSPWQAGNNIFLDDITIIDESACDQVTDLKVDQPREGEVTLSWKAPVSGTPTGYRIYRDGMVLMNNIQEPSFTDQVSLGQHSYCIVALFNKPDCSESQSLCIEVNVVAQCEPVANLVAQVTDSHTVTITWERPLASGVISYNVYRDGGMLTTVTDLTYTDTNITFGSHVYSVVVNYNKSCNMSDPIFSNYVQIEECLPITNLQAFTNTNKVTLNWDYAGGNGHHETLLSEGFEYGIPTSWENLDRDENGYIWTLNGGGQTGYCIVSLSYIDGGVGGIELLADNWLVTSPVILTGTELLKYYVLTAHPVYAQEHYGVYISTTGTDYQDFTLLFEETLTTAETNWSPRTIDLSAYSGQAYIAFRHHSIGVYAMALDEIKITSDWGDPSFDVYKDNVLIFNVSENSYIDTDVVTGENHTYCIQPIYTACTVNPVCKDVEVIPCDPAPVTDLYITGDQDTKEVYMTWEYARNENVKFQIYRNDEFIITTSDMSYSEKVEYDILYKYCIKPLDTNCPNGASDCDEILIEDPSAINEVKENSICIFPNPASTSVTIEGGNIIQVGIYNIAGQLIETIHAPEKKAITTIDVTAYKSGAYIFRLYTTDKIFINKAVMIAR